MILMSMLRTENVVLNHLTLDYSAVRQCYVPSTGFDGVINEAKLI